MKILAMVTVLLLSFAIGLAQTTTGQQARAPEQGKTRHEKQPASVRDSPASAPPSAQNQMISGNKPDGHQQQREQNQTKVLPVPVNVTVRLVQDEHHFLGVDWIVVFTGALAFLAIFQFVAMHRQAGYMRDQLGEMKTTSVDMGLLAVATRDYAKAMRLDQRAWVGVAAIKAAHPLTHGESFEVGVNVLNTGKTPAKGTGCMRVRLLEKFIGPDLSEAPWLPATIRSRSIYYPNALSHMSNVVRAGTEPIIFNAEEINDLRKGWQTIFVDGRIDYNDVFGHVHWLTFRYAWNADKEVFTQCEEGNETDDFTAKELTGNHHQ